MNLKQNILIILIIAQSLMACQSPTSTPTKPIPEVMLPAYPSPIYGANSYPAPTEYQALYNLKITPGEMPKPPSVAPQPEAGRGSASGILVSISRNTILPLNTFYLTPAIGENSDSPPPLSIGPDESKGDIVNTTNEKGEFYLSNIPPGNYFFIAWAPMNWPMSVISPEDPTYRKILISEDEITILGVVYIP